MEHFAKRSEARRNDPDIREKVSKVIKARQDALSEAAKLLEQAKDILQKNSHFIDDAIYARQVDAVYSTYYKLAEDAHFMNRKKTETYVGNLAAGALGEQIEEMGDKFSI